MAGEDPRQKETPPTAWVDGVVVPGREKRSAVANRPAPAAGEWSDGGEGGGFLGFECFEGGDAAGFHFVANELAGVGSGGFALGFGGAGFGQFKE